MALVSYLLQAGIYGACATPACLLMIWLAEKGDNPFRNPYVALRCFIAWWIAFVVGYIPGVVGVGPIFGFLFLFATTGILLDLAFHEGVWKGMWWATGTWSIVALTVLTLQLVLGRYGLCVM